MYARQQTWLPTARTMGLGAISFDDLRRAARRSRGMGQASVAAPSTGIVPGSPCYDPSHDNGINHCAGVASVLVSAFNPLGPQMTTTCSAAEAACLAGGATPIIPGTLTPAQQSVITSATPTTDVCSQTLGISCSTLMWAGVAALAAFAILKVVK